MENREVRLIDANALKDRILSAEDEIITDSAYAIGVHNGLTLAKSILINAPTIDLESLRQQWHDAETDPPKEPMEYIAMIKGGANTTTLLYDGGLWFEEDEVGWRTYYKVTHWMPFPKPPKKGD